jgi:hypothetical protein
MLNKPQSQNAAEGTAAIQAAGSADNAKIIQTNNYGLSASEVRAVAQDAFRADFFQMMGQAGDIAEARATKVVDRFLQRLQAENPAGLEQANSPDFRYALFSAQKAQARSGDENLETLLVELLIERSREKLRNLPQLVLTESLEVVPRLTDEQIAALTISFVIRRVSSTGIFDLEGLYLLLDRFVAPYVPHAKISETSFSHLAFTGCGVVEMGSITLTQAFQQMYPDLWQAGFEKNDATFLKLYHSSHRFIRPSAHIADKLEVIGGSPDVAESRWNTGIFDLNQRVLLKELLKRPSLNFEEIKNRTISARPYMQALFDLFENTALKHFNPSSVGIAIAHANIMRSTPDFGPLSHWIN